jgi:hypothetical protein
MAPVAAGDQRYRDMAAALKLVLDAMTDVEGIDVDSRGWGVPTIGQAAQDAHTALAELVEEMNNELENFDGKDL